MNRQSNFNEQNTALCVGMYNLQDGTNVEQLDVNSRLKVRSVIIHVNEAQRVAIGLCPAKIMLPFSYGCLCAKTDEVLSGREATTILLNEAAKQGIELPAVDFCVNFDRFGVKKGEAFLPSRYELQSFSLQGDVQKAWSRLGLLISNRTFWSSSFGINNMAWMKSFSKSAVTGWHIQYRTFGVMPAVEILF